MSDRAWDAVVVEVPAEAEDAVVGAGVRFSRGIQIDPLGAERLRVALYLAGGEPPDAALAAVRRAIEIAGVTSASEPRVERVEDGRWVERYQASLRPFDLGERFVVHPTGAGGAAGGRMPILLVPGRAFGTGEHPTTRMCVEELEQRVRPGHRWLDLGCGSAILAVAARRLGAAEVLALDVDPEAIAVAREVLDGNGVDGVEARVGSLDDARRGAWDGVVCNIGASFFLDHAGAVGALPAPGAPLIVTGFPDDEMDSVAAALVAGGLREEIRRRRPPWGALVLRRAEAG